MTTSSSRFGFPAFASFNSVCGWRPAHNIRKSCVNQIIRAMPFLYVKKHVKSVWMIVRIHSQSLSTTSPIEAVSDYRSVLGFKMNCALDQMYRMPVAKRVTFATVGQLGKVHKSSRLLCS
jgi:hypothetical protein